MSQWLAFATQLVGVRKSHQLALQFVDLLTQGLDLSDSLCCCHRRMGVYLCLMIHSVSSRGQ